MDHVFILHVSMTIKHSLIWIRQYCIGWDDFKTRLGQLCVIVQKKRFSCCIVPCAKKCFTGKITFHSGSCKNLIPVFISENLYILFSSMHFSLLILHLRYFCVRKINEKQQLSADFKFVYEQSLKQIFLKGAFLGIFENTIYKVITDHAQNQN